MGMQTYLIVILVGILCYIETGYSHKIPKPTFNECAMGIHTCHKRAICIDTKESYECVCEYGYMGDGRKCRPSCFEPRDFDRSNGSDILRFLDPVFECDLHKNAVITFRTCRLNSLEVQFIFLTPVTTPDFDVGKLNEICLPTVQNGNTSFKRSGEYCSEFKQLKHHLVRTYTVVAVVGALTDGSKDELSETVFMKFQCVTPKDQDISMLPGIRGVYKSLSVYRYSRNSYFDLRMSFYESELFLNKLQDNYVVYPNYIYANVEVVGRVEVQYSLQTKKCWATPSDDPNDPIQYSIIQNSEGVQTEDDPATVLIIKNNAGISAQFAFKAFGWANMKPYIFVHCLVHFCSDNYLCNETYIYPQFEDWPANGIEKRSVNRLHDIVSAGPLVVGHSPKPSCSEKNGGCEQICSQKPQGMKCSCRGGYKLSKNKMTCQLNGDSEEASLGSDELVNEYVTLLKSRQASELKLLLFFSLFSVILLLVMIIQCRNQRTVKAFRS